MITRLRRVLDGEGTALLNRMLVGLVTGAVLQGVGFVLLVPMLRALLGPDPSSTWPWIGALAAVFAIYAACYWTSIMTGYRLGSRLSRVLHHRLGDHVATLPLGWFTGTRSGQLAHLAGKGVVDVMGAPAHLLRPLVTAVVTPLVVVAGMALFDWRLALAALAGVPLAALAFRATTASVARLDHRADAASAEAGDRVIEFARLQPVLRAFRRTTEGHRTLDDALVEHRRAGRALLLGAAPAFLGVVLAVQLAFTIVLLVGTYLVLGGSVGAAELVALLVLAVRFAEPLIGAADLGAALRMARNALDRVADVLDEPPQPEPPESATPSGDGVEIDGVTFGYRDGEPVLDGVSLTVPPRGVTALVGASGTGKTTLLRLIARFHDVDGGAVRVGGVDVRELTTAELMRRISLVFQDVYLFDATIAENVRLAKPDATDDELAEVARRARLDEVVERLPDGWDTRVGEGGTALSGGERQRVSIARALLKDAPIVLLDEATAALDAENEAAVQQGLAALAADRTVVVVAHRLQTVVAADRIAVLAPAPGGSTVAELGTHTELLARDGRYAAFWAERTRARGWHLGTSSSRGSLQEVQT